ncbi:16S rRNA (adenine(1518)-N(6)/adenine(1519)-N(6))-dimethyltransferase RsmA [Metamycoplasma spumans]|uniref:16S rRNA (adenine(1518)-N(6)/adenine(1519)-N(6))- dimethyltransferase RsmA n=1 Tax=Metamycoplasma spumans TaxID=92406 RepID=UPI0034DDBA85
MEIKAKKSLGQNFLINKNIQNKIVLSAELENEDVIEIGPGLGALTYLIIPKAKSLVAYELDKELYERFINENHPENIKFINTNFLDVDLNNLNKKVIVIGNIPYNITSDILFKLLRSSNNIKHAVLMMQKEVCDRLLAKPNSKEYSKLSVSFQIYSNIKKILIAKANEFNPAPKVDSAVVRINFDCQDEYLINNQEKILNFIKICFQFKRKTLYNNLITNYSKDKILFSFEKLCLSLQIRAEALEVNQFIDLFKALN